MKKLTIALIAAATLSAGCTRIETGEVGLRINFSKEVEMGEKLPGSWNQTLVGDILTFPVKDIALTVDNKQPLTADNSALGDFDATIVYNINPSSVAEIYATKSKAFHAYDEKTKDTYLMYTYLGTIANNAIYKAVRKYDSLKVADNRVALEAEIRESMSASLLEEKLDKYITISKVQIRNIVPNAQILQAATDYVKAQNELRVKTTEVAIAQKEAERMAALANNSTQSIAYMNAQAALNISEGVKAGKVQTIIIPSNMTGLMIGSK
ncbi:MAG TPA: SPFH domain-containing protein [Allocoleopsis sp.]